MPKKKKPPEYKIKLLVEFDGGWYEVYDAFYNANNWGTKVVSDASVRRTVRDLEPIQDPKRWRDD